MGIKTTSDNYTISTVISISWKLNKKGFFIPIVEINPVEIDYMYITSVTEFNAKFVVDKGLGPGAIIQVKRINGMIPFIEQVIISANEPEMPAISYWWDEAHINIRPF